MNKLTKIGASALCGSLAAVSIANAGAIDVSGGANATWTSNEGTVTGNPIGLNSGLTFTGSGELDNGTTFKLTITQTDAVGLSAAGITLDTPSMGSFAISRAQGGGGIGSHDDKMPTAWEETWGAGLTAGIDMAKGVGSSTNVQYTTPSLGGLVTLSLAYSPRNDGSGAADKSPTGGATSYKQSGNDVVIDIAGPGLLSGLNAWAGYSVTQTDGGDLNQKRGDHEEGTAGITYAIGPVTAGFQRTGEFTGNQLAGQVEYYDNTAWGVSFNISDDLAISYGEFESKKHNVGSGKGAAGTVITEASSMQLSYTMGGASIQIAENSVDNANYTSGTASDSDGTTIRLSLAF